MSTTTTTQQADKLETILSRENMEMAWSAVKHNQGAAGVDRKTISATDDHLKQHWLDILDKLMTGKYHPPPYEPSRYPKPAEAFAHSVSRLFKTA